MSNAATKPMRYRPSSTRPLRLKGPHKCIRHHQSNQEGINRQTSRTAHQWRDHNGDQALLPIVNGAGSHNGRNGTCHTRYERNHTSSIEPEWTHESVKNKNHPAHIARFFQDKNESEKQGDLWNENHHTTQSGYDSFGYEIREKAIRQGVFHPLAHGQEKRVDKIHWPLRPGVNRLEKSLIECQGKSNSQKPDASVRDPLPYGG